jgi:hypothetical protein
MEFFFSEHNSPFRAHTKALVIVLGIFLAKLKECRPEDGVITFVSPERSFGKGGDEAAAVVVRDAQPGMQFSIFRCGHSSPFDELVKSGTVAC